MWTGRQCGRLVAQMEAHAGASQGIRVLSLLVEAHLPLVSALDTHAKEPHFLVGRAAGGEEGDGATLVFAEGALHWRALQRRVCDDVGGDLFELVGSGLDESVPEDGVLGGLLLVFAARAHIVQVPRVARRALAVLLGLQQVVAAPSRYKHTHRERKREREETYERK